MSNTIDVVLLGLQGVPGGQGPPGTSGVPTCLSTTIGVPSMAIVQLATLPSQRVPYDGTNATIPFAAPVGPSIGNTVVFSDTSNPGGNPGGCPPQNAPTFVDPHNPIQVPQGQGAIVLAPAGTPVPLPVGQSIGWYFTINTLSNLSYWASL